jgi:alkylresorcinol/alkylpyrone synthase
MGYIHSISTSIPTTFVEQADVENLAIELFSGTELDIQKYLPIFQNTLINKRPILMPIEYYSKDKTFKEKNDLFVETAFELSKSAILNVLEKSNTQPEEIAAFFLITSSGFVTPTLDARLIDAVSLSTDCIRIPLVGLGCAGGCYGLARANEFTKLYPNKKILLVAVETCTLTFRPSDKRKANLVALSLFSDGASALLLSSEKKEESIEIFNSKSRKWRNTLDIMGWEVAEDGLQVIFDRSIPYLIKKNYLDFYKNFLNENSLENASIKHFLFHPGGAKVLQAFEEVLERDSSYFFHSYEILKNFGNLSSPTIYFVIENFLKEKKFTPNELGVFSAMGPGFSGELSYFKTS